MPFSVQVGWQVAKRMLTVSFTICFWIIASIGLLGLVIALLLLVMTVFGRQDYAYLQLLLLLILSMISWVILPIYLFIVTPAIICSVINGIIAKLVYQLSHAPTFSVDARFKMIILNFLTMCVTTMGLVYFLGTSFYWLITYMVIVFSCALVLVIDATYRTNLWLADTLDYKPKRKVKANAA